MEFLNLPEQLKGKWQNALFLTYTVDFSFFERTLLREFYKTCRNIIILIDGFNFLEACNQHSKSQLLHLINNVYIAEGIYNVSLSHAKLILLTNETEGRLILGSGNLGLRGYSLNGEVFIKYEYNENLKDNLDIFIDTRDFFEALIKRNFILGEHSKERIYRLFNNSLWLFGNEKKSNQPIIIHNLKYNLVKQIEDIIAGRKVEELIILSPFYDKNCNALRKILNIFNPLKARLLIQDKHASIEISVLKNLMSELKGRLLVNKINPISSKYIHAKLYLFKLKDSSLLICGSPNLSMNAMFKEAPTGNIEIANVSMGKVEEFDDLLNLLNLGNDENDLDNFELKFISENTDKLETEKFTLLSGSLEKNKIILYFNGEFPKNKNIILAVGNEEVEIGQIKIQNNVIVIELSEKEVELLFKLPSNPIRLKWQDEKELIFSNSIFILNIISLKNFLNISDGREKLDLLENIHLDEPEILDILNSLNNNLILNDESLWKISKNKNDFDDLETEENINMNYEEINYEAIFNSPKYLQYKARGIKKIIFDSLSPIQIILNSISKHFEKISNINSYLKDITKKINGEEDKNLESEEEAEAREEEKQNKTDKEKKRLRIVFNNFIKKFLKGINSKNFQNKVDYEIMIKNYTIFNNLLLRLFDMEWADKPFLIKSFLNTWDFFWGKNGNEGYLEKLNKDQKKDTLTFLKEYHSNAQLLAGLYKSINYLNSGETDILKFELRNFFRKFLISDYFKINHKILMELISYLAVKNLNEKEILQDFINSLKNNIYFETRTNFIKKLASTNFLGIKNCNFTKVKVRRNNREEMVNCLEIIISKFLNVNECLEILKQWINFEKLDYYRLQAYNNSIGIYYDFLEKQGKYWIKKDSDFQSMAIDKIETSLSAWEKKFRNLEITCEEFVDSGFMKK